MTELFQSRLCAPFLDMYKQIPDLVKRNMRQIHLRTGGKALLIAREKYGLTYEGLTKPSQGWKPEAKDIRKLFLSLCQNTPYLQEKAIREGYLSLPDGCRVGIAGQVILESNGEVRSITPITSLSFRFAHAVKGCADSVFPYLWDKNGKFFNTLILSAPGMGKTTLLRDLVRQISNAGMQTVLLDERNEVAACHEGSPALDVGMNTDILQNCTKEKALCMALRALSPELIALDEIVTGEEGRKLMELAHCGVRLLASAHADSLTHAICREAIALLLQEKIFDRIILLADKVGQVSTIYDAQGEKLL